MQQAGVITQPDQEPEADESQASATQPMLQLLTFTIGEESFGIDLTQVREVKGWTATTRLPNSQPSLRGVLNLRGVIVPIFDLRLRFSGAPTQASDKHVIIILTMHERTIGILVDTVSDILTISQDEIKPAPQIDPAASSEQDSFVKGLITTQDEGRMVVALDLGRLLEQEITSALEEGSVS